MAINFADIDRILGNRGVQAGIQGLGAGLSALGRRRSENEDRELSRERMAQDDRHFEANLRLAMDRDRQDASARTLEANPLGAEESFAAKRALLRAIMPSVGQYGSPDARANVTTRPNLATPEVMGHLSEDATRAAIEARRKNLLNLDSRTQFSGDTSGADTYRAQVMDRESSDIMSALGRGQTTTGLVTPTEDGQTLDRFNETMRGTPIWQQFMQGKRGLDDSGRKQLRSILEQNGYTFADGMEIDPAGNVNQNKGFGPIAKRVGRVATAAAPVALNFIPGVGPALQLALSAAANAGGTKLNGGSWKDAALSGAVGAATNYATSKLPLPKFGKPTPQPLASPRPTAALDFLRGQKLVGRG